MEHFRTSKVTTMGNSNLAFNLRMLRRSKGLSTNDLSLAIGMNSNKISHLENDRKIRVLPEEIAAIADYFEISILDLTEKRAKIIFT